MINESFSPAWLRADLNGDVEPDQARGDYYADDSGREFDIRGEPIKRIDDLTNAARQAFRSTRFGYEAGYRVTPEFYRAAHEIIEAYLIAGPAPAVHQRAAQRKLAKEWPTMSAAVKRLVDARNQGLTRPLIEL